MKTFPPRVHAYGLPATAEGPWPVNLPQEEERPDLRGPGRFLLWLLRQCPGLFWTTTLLATFWYVLAGLSPWFLGRTIDAGVASGSLWATLGWAVLLLTNIAVSSVAGTVMHTTGVGMWLNVMYRTTLLVNRKAISLGHNLPRRTPTGEVLSVASGDADIFGAVGEVMTRAIASAMAVVVVAIVVLQESTRLGLVVLVAAPLMVMLSWPLLKPLGEARMLQRSRSSTLTGMATDIVAGLRILRGIGGERTFGDNYTTQSQSVREASNRAAPWQAGVDALASLMSGGLMVVVTWLGTKEVLAGALTPGQLVSFFGYAVFLVGPIQTIFMFLNRWNQGRVSAEKAIGVLSQTPPWTAEQRPVALADGDVVDAASGFHARAGQLTVIVSAAPDDSARLADRLGRYLSDEDGAIGIETDDSLKGRAARRERARLREQRREQEQRDRERAAGEWGVTIGGLDLSRVSLHEVREHVLVSDAQTAVFAGTLQSLVDPHGRATREQAESALRTASAEDVYDAVPGGWAGRIDEKGRGLSGGQRQRLVLARALVQDPPVLVLVEPTSAVDAHTEARIASRLPHHRRGRTTIITTVSPLWLHEADRVVLMVDGHCVAAGTHTELLSPESSCAEQYRSIVARGEEGQHD